jgi:hypothetical protein
MTIPNIVDSLRRLSDELEKFVFNENYTHENYRDGLIAFKARAASLSDQIREKKEVWAIIQNMKLDDQVFSNPWKTAVNLKIHSIIKLEERLDGLIEECGRVLSRRITDTLISIGQVDRALARCVEILSSAPWDDHTHRILSEMSCNDYPDVTLNKIRSCQNTFRMRYLKTIGQGILTEPQSLNISADGEVLFVSDQSQNVVHRFTMDGDHLGICGHSFIKPHGMCNDENNRIWACDYLGQQLIILDRSGKCEKEISLKGFHEWNCPYSICLYHGNLYILASDLKGCEYSLLKFSIEKLNVVSCYSARELGTPYGLWCSGGKIFIGSLTRGRVYFFDPCIESFHGLDHDTNVRGLKSFAVAEDSIFFSSARSVVKSTKIGEKIFSSNLDRVIGGNVCLNFGLAVTQSHENIMLVLPDGFNKCVHVFSV